MMQSVVLDGTPLIEEEDMRLLTCVVLDGNPPDEVILDMMDLVNDVFPLKGNPLDEDNGNLLDEFVLDRISLDELKLMYLQ